MSETPTNVTTPPDLTYGYVDGRIILAIGDRSDAGRMPDPVPADGMTVTFTPANTILKVTTPTPATVIKQPIVCSVDANGYLIDGQEARGVWLVTGVYKVTYSHPRAMIPSHDIEVTTGHTEAAPLDLTTAMPPGGPVLAPSEYAELNGRIAILTARSGTALGALMSRFSDTAFPGASVSQVSNDDLGTVFTNPEGAPPAELTFFSGQPADLGGGYGFRNAPTGATNPQSIYCSFGTVATKFSVMVVVWGDTDITVYVDGQPVAAHPTILTGSGYQHLVVDGLPDGAHEVVVILGWASSFVQIVRENGDALWAGAVPSFTLALTGDSYTDSGVPPYFAGPARELHRLTGWEIGQLGQGSTGYTNNAGAVGGKQVYGGASRIAALEAFNPDAVMVVGSVNDGAATPTALKSAALSFYAELSPLPVIVVGVEPLYDADDPAYANWDSLNAALAEAADEAPNVIAFIDWRSEDWLTGTGSVSDPQGDGNQDAYIGDSAGTDTIHANYWGQRYLMGLIVDRLRSIRIT